MEWKPKESRRRDEHWKKEASSVLKSAVTDAQIMLIAIWYNYFLSLFYYLCISAYQFLKAMIIFMVDRYEVLPFVGVPTSCGHFA